MVRRTTGPETKKTNPPKVKGPAAAKESAKARAARALAIIEQLKKDYPDASCALDFRNPLELLVATILSAQCTDARVNIVTKDLFQKYTKAQDYLDVAPEELEKDIHSTGFFRQKAKSIRGCCQALIDEHGGTMPGTLDALVKLPGVGRKTANVILGECFNWPAIVVDTHMKRLAGRLGLTANTDPDKIEMDLRELIPDEEATLFTHRLITHGRQICNARKPQCAVCNLAELCPSQGKA